MPVLLSLRRGRSPNPLSFLLIVILMAVFVQLIRSRVAPSSAGVEEAACPDPDDPTCDAGTVSLGATSASRATVLAADDVCRGAGYLCAELEAQGEARIMRWRDGTGTLAVYVPAPTFEDRAAARRLQRSAMAGIRAWNGHPFPIRIDERSSAGAHVVVRWVETLGGNRIGVARTQWHPTEGLTVRSLSLATRSPFGGRGPIAPRQVQLTAAHEMGHALGLPHSDSERDVMYPTNTATSLSARDYRTMEALYELQDGVVIR